VQNGITVRDERTMRVIVNAFNQYVIPADDEDYEQCVKTMKKHIAKFSDPKDKDRVPKHGRLVQVEADKELTIIDELLPRTKDEVLQVELAKSLDANEVLTDENAKLKEELEAAQKALAVSKK